MADWSRQLECGTSTKVSAPAPRSLVSFLVTSFPRYLVSWSSVIFPHVPTGANHPPPDSCTWRLWPVLSDPGRAARPGGLRSRSRRRPRDRSLEGSSGPERVFAVFHLREDDPRAVPLHVVAGAAQRALRVTPADLGRRDEQPVRAGAARSRGVRGNRAELDEDQLRAGKGGAGAARLAGIQPDAWTGRDRDDRQPHGRRLRDALRSRP